MGLLTGRKEVRSDRGGGLQSEILGLTLQVEGGQLRLYESATGRRLPTPMEEKEVRQAAEAELERLRAEMERLRER
ncbi:MAG: hypothetical protein HYY20_00765 [Candidatus Tectomicrobia bacterium]|uniref:Uncharacterized protein n=1 Tax=Tectimicrobiota bacterium TaxID=2528274 RepID=A0A932CL67_UNCTE|nr:hypothetical protein [Candidatus Tectomicrobia bacterium]